MQYSYVNVLRKRFILYCIDFNGFLIFRIFVIIIVKFFKDLKEDYGHVLVKDIITFLEYDFGKDQVITIRISIINVYIYILN